MNYTVSEKQIYGHVLCSINTMYRMNLIHESNGIGKTKVRTCFCIGPGGTWIATDTKTSAAINLLDPSAFDEHGWGPQGVPLSNISNMHSLPNLYA